MFKRFAVLIAAVLLFGISSADAIVGLGVHYTLDMSLSMKDVTAEAAVFDSLKIQTSSLGILPPGYSVPLASGADLPIKVDRTGFASTPIDFGGKLYVDVIPFLDAIEISGNLGLWQYVGKLIYPSSMDWKTTQPTDPAATFKDRVDFNYDTLNLALASDSSNTGFMGLTETPYAKLNLNFTIRKNILTFPPIVNIIKLYAGGGLSLNFATPALSAGLIEDAMGTSLDTTLTDPTALATILGGAETQDKILKEILNRLMTPHYGCHIVVGTAVKLPVIPIGLYIDGKFMIPFDKLDSSVDIGSTGLLINAGITLGL